MELKLKVRNKGYSGKVTRKLLNELVSLNGRIGFRGYTKNDIVERSNGVLTYSPTNIVNNKIVNYKSDTYISQYKYEESPEIMVKNKNILFVKTGSTLGKSALVRNLTEPATINHQLIVIKTIHVDSDYLAVYLLTESIQKQIFQVKIGGAVPTLTETEIGKFVVKLPSLPEQSAIGSLFRILDDLLDSYKENLANYQSLKATMLSKMFPKAGQTVPEIRLDGFEGEWEVKELGNIVDFYTGLTYKPNDMVSEGTLVLRSSNVRDGEFIYKDNVFVNPDIVNCQNVKLGDIVVVVRNGSRDLIGKHALIKSEMPNTVIGAFMTGVRYDASEFVNALLDTDIFISEINKNLGSTINQITTGNFKRMKFRFPDKEEQRAIGSYFANLENVIAAHREKITQLETLKKKLLQDMFI